MTEEDICLALGLLDEPCANRFRLTDELKQDLASLVKALRLANEQKEFTSLLNAELWAEFLPWHSLN